MSLTDDRSKLDTTIGPNGQQKSYLVLSEEERAKGFVRPVRTGYVHVGIIGPTHPVRDLTEEEAERYKGEGYAKYEVYPAGGSVVGRFWTQAEIDSIDHGCRTVTKMARELAETYARSPGFYGATFCAGCKVHLPVGARGEFVWEGTDIRVGT